MPREFVESPVDSQAETKEQRVERLKSEVRTMLEVRKNQLKGLGSHASSEALKQELHQLGARATKNQREHKEWIIGTREKMSSDVAELEALQSILDKGEVMVPPGIESVEQAISRISKG